MTKEASRPKVSVVVPIYNVERYLEECVDSILGQTLKEIEVILVDDGSPDKCGEIVDRYAAKDKRVVAIHQENAGYSTAVNRGIDEARGEYIGIIESDDWIEPDMYERLYADAKKNQTDITKGMFSLYNSTLPEKYRDTVYINPSGIDLRNAPSGAFTAAVWPQIIGFHASIWSSIYRADFVKRIKIPETAGASYQDFPFMMEAMIKAKRISVVKRIFVHWRNDPDQGNSTAATGKKLLLMGENTLSGLKILQESKKFEKVRKAFYAHALWSNISFFYKIDREYKDEYYKLLREIFKDVRDDEDFEFLRREDYRSMRAILKYPTWTKFYLSHILGGIKRLPLRVVRRIRRAIDPYFYMKDRVVKIGEELEPDEKARG